jgi:hypothetical protein
MVALTAARNTPEAKGDIFEIGMAAATIVLQGALVAVNAAGFATKGAVSTTLKQFGMAKETVDNTAGANGAKTIKVKTGIFRWANHGADLVTVASIGADCFIQDDQTVAATNGGATRSRAGKVVWVDALGVYVQMGPQF